MPEFKNLSELLKSNPTEQDCINYLEQHLWKGETPTSPFDPTSKVYKCANNQYRCKNTKKYFNVKTGTVFRNSNIPLRKWFQALYFLTSFKKGITSLQLAEEISVTQKTAWFVSHRLRKIFERPEFIKNLLKNDVEMDETYLGGKNKNRHKDKKVPHSQGQSCKGKMPIWGAMERESGNLIAEVVPNTQQKTLEPIIRANVKKGSNVYTDEWHAYNDLYKEFNHQRVNHRAKQYVNEKAHTNSIENRWSHLKRMVYGTYHWISKKHAQKYVDEFTFRNNTRKYSQQERFDLALSSVVGKRLTYQELVNC